MRTRVITIASGKGGVGKTTTTANIGAALAMQHQRVVVIDTDIGLRNLDMVMGLQNRIIYDIVDLVEGRCRIRQALIRDRILDELYLLPAAQSRDKTAVSVSDMLHVCEELKGQCDFVLIDAPAGIEHGFRNAIAPASEFILVTTPDVTAIQDVDRVLGILESEGRGPIQLVVNRVRGQLVKRQEIMSPEEIVAHLSVELLGTVPDDENVIIGDGHGVPVVHNVRAPASKSFRSMAARLLGEDVPTPGAPVRRRGLWAWLGLRR
ncbi:MAG: septum site-determining protein MinD [Chloroflexi bacterium]|jgi:septum site-determining protein MinD|nr:septum site-determining protein MinD [Chloroflexota bacterium]